MYIQCVCDSKRYCLYVVVYPCTYISYLVLACFAFASKKPGRADEVCEHPRQLIVSRFQPGTRLV
jgi:hypothetical protein